MPKLKSNKGAAKRFKANAAGKFKRRQGFRNHILTKKPTKRKRHLRGDAMVAAVDTPGLRRLLPYA